MPDTVRVSVSGQERLADLVVLGGGSTPANGAAGTTANPLVVSGGSSGSSALKTGVSRSGTITTGGVAQLVAAANATRGMMSFTNISDTVMYLSEVTATPVANTAGAEPVLPGGYWEAVSANAVYVICATTGKAFTSVEA